jgi:membrane peptidoglycan carboxypeptidase
MGYDDTTPLRGVTGGGLPADIWRETMLRITEGKPATPLRMIRPARAPSVTPIAPEPRIPRPGSGILPRSEGQQRTTEDVILDVLGRIFGN